MVSYKIEWRRSTKKDLRKIPKVEVQKIILAVEVLSNDPRPINSKKLSGSEYTHRIRVGDYRVIYEIDDDTILIEIIKLGHRREIYKTKG